MNAIQITFLLCTLTKSSPPVRVLTMENVESILHHAAYSYISKEVLVEKKVVSNSNSTYMVTTRGDFGDPDPSMYLFSLSEFIMVLIIWW